MTVHHAHSGTRGGRERETEMRARGERERERERERGRGMPATPRNLRHDTAKFLTRLIPTCDMTHSHV